MKVKCHIYEIHDQNILQELSSWLYHINWMIWFDEKNIKMLHDFIIESKWNPENSDDKLYLIWESIAHVIEECWKSARDYSNQDWKLILHWLINANKIEYNQTSFNIYIKQSIKKDYIKY